MGAKSSKPKGRRGRHVREIRKGQPDTMSPSAHKGYGGLISLLESERMTRGAESSNSERNLRAFKRAILLEKRPFLCAILRKRWYNSTKAQVLELADLPAQAGAHGLGAMFYVYLLRSKTKKWVYVGMTNDLKERVNRHNFGREKTTKPYKPFELIFAQEFKDRSVARDFEKFLKIRWNKEALLKVLDQ